MTSEHDYEPVRGLPAPLPPGENVLWQGSPRWQTLAVRAFHVRKVAVYFGLLLALRAARGNWEGATAGPELASLVALAGVALAALAILATLAILVWHFYFVFLAVSRSLTRPFTHIDSAAVRIRRDGTGDIPLELRAAERLGYLVNWPHVRPWHFVRPQPMLRALPDVSHAAETLARALAAAAGTSVPATAVEPTHDRSRAVGEPRASVAA